MLKVNSLTYKKYSITALIKIPELYMGKKENFFLKNFNSSINYPTTSLNIFCKFS